MPPSPKSRLRDVARKVLPGQASRGLEPLLASGLFDPWYYGLQTRVEREPLDAAAHFVREGAAAGFLPNPLTDVEASGLDADQLVEVLLAGHGRQLPVRSLLDVDALGRLHPAVAIHPGGPVGFYLERARSGAPVPDLGPRSWTRFAEQRTKQSKALQVIIDSGLFDHDYYRRQAARSFLSERAAIWHFLETGESAGHSPTPLYERGWYRSKAGVSMPMTFRHFLLTGQVEGAAGPHFDAVTYVARTPEGADHPGGPLGHFLAHAAPHDLTVPAPDSGVEPVRWDRLHDLLLATTVVGSDAPVDWDVVRAGLPGRAHGRVSALVTTHDDRHLTRAAVESVLAEPGHDLDVVVVAEGSHREVPAILAACFAADPRVRVLRRPGGSHPHAAVDAALAASTGEIAILLAHDVRARPGWLEPLLTALGPADVLGVQPVVMSADDTVWSAGIVSQGPGAVPTHLWAGHPVDDVPDGPLRVDAVSSVCLAMRATHLVQAQGLDAAHGGLADVDLCLRLAATTGGRFETITTSRVSRQLRDVPPPDTAGRAAFLGRWADDLPAVDPSHWERSGFRLDGSAPTLQLSRPAAIVAGGPATGLPRLRWAIKIAAKGGPYGDEWGDTYFAADLARGLREWGQEAFVDRRGAHRRPGVDHLDDVTLTLRGRWPAVIQPGATNVLWVISHPDEVPDDEITQGFDLVYAAGRAWAEQVSARTAQDVRTLLQATDTARFSPDGDAMPGLGTLFVGRTRKVLRPVVRDAVAAGADLTIFGDGWEQFIDPGFVRADHLANALVPSAYRGARIVLNDHWADMAELGFYSNRLFDAVASGARVVSDPVDGVERVLGPSVRTYRTVDELRHLVEPGSTAWPDDATIVANARRVAAEHSFAARARVLLADVLDARGVTHDLHDRGE
ncbi:MAG: glycosyltransferase [Aeromicrobium sp.]